MVFWVSSPPWILMYFFEGFFLTLTLCMTKLRVLVLCFSYFTDNSTIPHLIFLPDFKQVLKTFLVPQLYFLLPQNCSTAARDAWPGYKITSYKLQQLWFSCLDGNRNSLMTITTNYDQQIIMSSSRMLQIRFAFWFLFFANFSSNDQPKNELWKVLQG